MNEDEFAVEVEFRLAVRELVMAGDRGPFPTGPSACRLARERALRLASTARLGADPGVMLFLASMRELDARAAAVRVADPEPDDPEIPKRPPKQSRASARRSPDHLSFQRNYLLKSTQSDALMRAAVAIRDGSAVTRFGSFLMPDPVRPGEMRSIDWEVSQLFNRSIVCLRPALCLTALGNHLLDGALTVLEGDSNVRKYDEGEWPIN